MKAFRKMFGFKTRPEKAADLDRMSIMTHRRTSTRPCDLVRVSYDAGTDEFVVTDQARKETRFRERKETERQLSRWYRLVREHIDEGCHH